MSGFSVFRKIIMKKEWNPNHDRIDLFIDCGYKPFIAALSAIDRFFWVKLPRYPRVGYRVPYFIRENCSNSSPWYFIPVRSLVACLTLLELSNSNFIDVKCDVRRDDSCPES